MVSPRGRQGDANAQNNLGIMYINGEGVPQDYAEAAQWYRLAADQGHTNAQFILGVMYQEGEGVPQDLVAAHMWLSLAAEESPATNRVTDELRDNVEEDMTSEQIAEAQRLAREWKPISER